MDQSDTSRVDRRTLTASRRLTGLAGSVLFTLALLLPGIALLRGGEAVSLAEQRTLATLPPLPRDRHSLETFPARMDAFTADQFGFRSTLVRWNNLLHVYLGVSPSGDVIFGRHGWMFLGEGRLPDQNRGVDPLSATELDAFVNAMLARQRMLADRGIPLVVMPVPDKQSVYPEYLPDWLQPRAPSRLRQAVDAMARAGLNVVDVQATLTDSQRRGADTYMVTDTHWNCYGAWLGYQALMQKILPLDLPGVRELPASRVQFRENSAGRPGDFVVNQLHLEDLYTEPHRTICTIDDRRKVQARRLSGALVRMGAYSLPDEAVQQIHGRADGVRRHRVLMFRDSFARSMAPFLLNSFDEILFTGQNKLSFDPALVDFYQPDLVIYQFVERFLAHPPDNSRLDAPVIATPD